MGALVAIVPSCSFMGATGELGFTHVGLTGDVALASATGGVPDSAYQDLGQTMGLGSEVGSPYLRGQLDLGNLVLTGSAFSVSEEGSGTVATTFGPLSAGTAVRSKLDLANAKVSLTHDFGFGPVKISPGLAVDVVDFRLTASEPTFGNEGEIDEFLPLPMLFCRAEGDIGVVAILAEVGYLDVPEVEGAEVALLDLEAMLEWRVLPTVQ